MSDSNVEAEPTENYDPNETGYSQPGEQDASIPDLLLDPLTKAYVKPIVALYALLGAVMGLMVIFSDVVDSSIVDGTFGTDMLSLTFVAIPINGVPHIAAVVGLVVGGYLGVRMAAGDKQTMLAGATGTLAGTIVLWLLSSLLAASQLDGASVEFGGLILNGIVLGLLAGGLTAGTVYIMRNLVPDVQDPAA